MYFQYKMAQGTFFLRAACRVAATFCVASCLPSNLTEAQDHQKEVQEVHLAPVRRMCQNEACLAGTQKSQHLGVGKTQGQGSDAHNRIWEQEDRARAAQRLQEASGSQQELEVLLLYHRYLTVLSHSQHFLQELGSHRGNSSMAGHQSH